jgi:2'-hydroxyisoflavone reductase
MDILVLGGTVFLSRAVAAEALARGHDVTVACRGTSGPVPDGARLVTLDRAAASGEEVADRLRSSYDAVVDVARHPSWVRRAVAAVPDAHWVFVSTCNVYPDTDRPGGGVASLRTHEPIETDEDPSSAPEVYGAMKVACEQTVRDGARSSTVIRPGLVVGPDDPSGRFAYWPARLADGGEVLAPGDPADTVQVIDVRDLASWIVDCAERRTTGTYDGVGERMPRAEFLTQVAAGVDGAPGLCWVPQDFLVEQKVEPWSGKRSIPLWLPLPEYAGFMDHDDAPSRAAGLTTRPVSDTARDTLAWLRATRDAKVTGLTRDEEAELLAAFTR